MDTWVQPTDDPGLEVMVPDAFRVLSTSWLRTRIDGTSVQVRYGKTAVDRPQTWFDDLKVNLESEFYVGGAKIVGAPVCDDGDVDVCWARISGRLDGDKASGLVIVAEPAGGGAGVTVLVTGSPEDLSVHAGEIDRMKTGFRRGGASSGELESLYSGPPNTAQEAVIDGWSVYTSPMGPRMKMPSQPAASTRISDSLTGPLETKLWTATSMGQPMSVYILATTDYPDTLSMTALPAELLLKYGVDGMVTGSKGTLLGQTDTTFADVPARDFVIQTASPFPMYMVGRIFLVGNRLYVVAVSTTDPAGQLWGSRWMDTLEL